MDAARLENMVITFNYDIGARGIIVIFFLGGPQNEKKRTDPLCDNRFKSRRWLFAVRVSFVYEDNYRHLKKKN